MLESRFQTRFIRKLERKFPGLVAIKNDAGHTQGIPDWSIFWGPHWAMLEIKGSRTARRQPNQEYYIAKFNEMGGFAAFVYPENESEVLSALEQAFSPRGPALVSKPELLPLGQL